MFSKITHPKNNSPLMKFQTLGEHIEDGSGGDFAFHGLQL
jgi:hypothetical protein